MLDSRQLAALPVFQEFYRLIRRLFGLDIALLAPDGTHGAVLGRGRELNRFCAAFQRQPEGRRRCVACDARHARAAARDRRPRRYACHAGLTEFIIPIVVEQAVVAHLQCGQVADRPLTDADGRRVRPARAGTAGKTAALRRLYLRSPVMAPARQNDLMALLRLFAQLAATARAKELLLDQEPRARAAVRALQFLGSRFREDVGVGQTAAAAGVSPRTLARLLRERTGASLVEHLHRLRVAQARDDLEHSHAKILDIALACGFGSVQQFNRVFRGLTGLAPSRWRHRRRAGSGARGREEPSGHTTGSLP